MNTATHLAPAYCLKANIRTTALLALWRSSHRARRGGRARQTDTAPVTRSAKVSLGGSRPIDTRRCNALLVSGPARDGPAPVHPGCRQPRPLAPVQLRGLCPRRSLMKATGAKSRHLSLVAEAPAAPSVAGILTP